MRHRKAAGLAGAILAVVLAVVSQWGRGSAQHPAGPSPRPQAPASAKGFRSHERLIEHFEKHGLEFAGISIDEYLRRGQSLRDRAAGEDLLERVQDDGVVTRFDRTTGEFGAFDADGIIRTFFRPKGGEAYFRRQAARDGG